MKILVCSQIAIILGTSAVADMGSIPFKGTATVLEPTQRAIIAHNGKEQLLILSTDLQADQETKVLEIMPFPSEPTIAPVDSEIFKRVTALINRKKPRFHEFVQMGSGAFAGLSDEANLPAGEVTFHDRIGAHDISTLHVLRPESFISWAEDYLKSQGVDTPVIPEPLKAVVRQYISENFNWFVFDVIDLSPTLITKEALQFRFPCEFVFYPMRITKTEKGSTTVRLLVMTQGLFNEHHLLGLQKDRMRLVHDPVTFTGNELAQLNMDIFLMLDRPDSINVRHWEITGPLNGFDDDVIVGDALDFIRHLRQQARGENGEPAPASQRPPEDDPSR